jgi:ERF superfamily protein
MSDKEHRAITRAGTLPTTGIMHPLAEKILAGNPTPETLRELMTLQREHEAAMAKRAFTTALVALKGALPNVIGRDKRADMGQGRPKYNYASLANVMREVTPALVNHGFSVSAPATTSVDAKGQTVVTVTATLTHHAGHSEHTVLSGPVDTTGAKSAIQGIGSSITYLQRYAVLSILGIATDDMTEPGTTSEKSGPAGEQVDVPRNLKALQFFIQKGKTKDDVEKYVGKPVAEWALVDLDRLRDWGTQKETPQPAPQEQAPADPDIFLYHCPDCPFKTEIEEDWDGHMMGTGHGQKPKTATTKARKA